MALVIADINGYETPIEIHPESLGGLSTVSAEGSSSGYRIEYGNGLVEMGGEVIFTTTVEKDGYREGATQIELPFEIIDAQATAINTIESVNTVYGESAFIRVNGNTLGIYGSFTGTSHKEMKVKWYAKGVVNGN